MFPSKVEHANFIITRLHLQKRFSVINLHLLTHARTDRVNLKASFSKLNKILLKNIRKRITLFFSTYHYCLISGSPRDDFRQLAFINLP